MNGSYLPSVLLGSSPLPGLPVSLLSFTNVVTDASVPAPNVGQGQKRADQKAGAVPP